MKPFFNKQSYFTEYIPTENEIAYVKKTLQKRLIAGAFCIGLYGTFCSFSFLGKAKMILPLFLAILVFLLFMMVVVPAITICNYQKGTYKFMKGTVTKKETVITYADGKQTKRYLFCNKQRIKANKKIYDSFAEGDELHFLEIGSLNNFILLPKEIKDETSI